MTPIVMSATHAFTIQISTDDRVHNDRLQHSNADQSGESMNANYPESSKYFNTRLKPLVHKGCFVRFPKEALE